MLFKSMFEWLGCVIRGRWGENGIFFIKIGGGYFININVKFIRYFLFMYVWRFVIFYILEYKNWN